MSRRLFSNGRWAGGLLVVLTPAYFLVPWQALPGVRDALGVPFVLLYAIFLPGFVLGLRAPIHGYDVLERVATGALVGLALFMGAAFVWALTGLSLDRFQLALPVLVVLVAVWGLIRKRRREDTEEFLSGAAGGDASDASPRANASRTNDALDDGLIPPPSRGSRGLAVAFALFLVLTFALVLHSGVPLELTADTLDHVGYVSEIAQSRSLFPTTAFYLDPGPNGEDLRKGLMHVLYGFSSCYLHLGALSVLNAMNAFLAVVLLLSVYGSARILFRSRTVGILSSILFLIAVDRGLGGTAIRQSFFTQRIAIAFFLYVLAFGLYFLESGKRRALVPVAVFSFAAIATHIFFGVLIAFAGATLLVWKFCFPQNDAGRHLSRVTTIGLAAAAGLLPYGVYRYITAFPQANELHREIQGVVFLTSNLYIADPFPVYKWFGPVGILSALTIFPLWRVRDRHPALGYVFASYFTLAAVLFNPILLPPIRSAMSYLIARFNVICPFYFAGAFFLVAFAGRGQRGIRLRPSYQILAVLIALAALFNLVPTFRDNAFSRSTIEREKENSYLRWNEGLRAIDGRLPPRSVIASDPLTSYSVTAFTPYYTVCTFDQHAPPNDVLLEERMKAVRDIMSPYVPMERTAELLAKSRATHVIVNGRFPAGLRLEYWSMDRELFPAMRGKFESHPEAFAVVQESDGFVTFAWNGRLVPSDSTFANPFVLRALPQEWSHVGEAAGEAVLEGFTLGRTSLSPGEPLDVFLAWSPSGEYGFKNYAVALRFDHTNPGLPFGGRPFPKIARKIKEKLTGRSYRFTEFHKIHGGFLGPDTWRPGELVLDETRVHVPPGAAAGEYTLRVKLLTLQHQPTYRIKDVFFDDDVYAGIVVARITIR